MILTGYFIADEEIYKNRRTKFIVINGNKEIASKKSTPDLKGVENTMKKNCYHRKDGRWQYSKQENGLKYYAIANTYRELLEKIKNIKPKLIKNVKVIKTKKLTFIQWYQTYIDTFIKTQNIKEKSKQDWQRYLDNYIKPAFQRIPLEKLTSEQIQKFVNEIPRDRTRKTIYQNIIRVLKKAYATDKIKKDITLAVDRPLIKPSKQRSPLTYAEQSMLLDYVKNTNLYSFVMFSLVVGSRREETLSFCLDDIDEKSLLIHIKGTKTKNADRYVHVTEAFIKFLKSNMHSNKFNFKKDYITKQIHEVFKKLNIDNCLHGLRHTCSANLYFLGAKDKYRQQQLGHSSIVITNDIYTNIRENISKAKLKELYRDLYPSFD